MLVRAVVSYVGIALVGGYRIFNFVGQFSLNNEVWLDLSSLAASTPCGMN
jgi:hypothetical protein